MSHLLIYYNNVSIADHSGTPQVYVDPGKLENEGWRSERSKFCNDNSKDKDISPKQTMH